MSKKMNSDLISKSELIDDLKDWRKSWQGMSDIKECEWTLNIINYTLKIIESQSTVVNETIAKLEKQVAKRPTLEGENHNGEQLIYEMWYCPNCKQGYKVDYDYCPNCGQKINWNKESEE